MTSSADKPPSPPAAAEAMSTGGDARIRLDPATGLNRYYSAPRPSPVLAYASSTANDISPEGFARAERLLDETTRPVPIADIVGVGNRRATGCDDLVRHLVGRAQITARAVGAAPEVVHDDRRTLGGEQQRMLASEPATRTGHDCDTSLEHPCHVK
jgi:hypothetical protein